MSSTPPNLWAGLSNPQRRTAVSHVLYFGMVGFGFVGSVAKLVNPSITLGLPILICDIFWIIIASFFGLWNTIMIDYDILEIGGYVASIVGTVIYCTWHFTVPIDQLYLYLPALVNLGIFIAAIVIAIIHKTPEQRAELMNGLRGFKHAIVTFSLSDICGEGSTNLASTGNGEQAV